ncbi:tRNA-dihydrouridine(47) synthase [NAD(P)(+)]-like [Aricia agestis]|uniref:tRNA-dihydrouridine(47) synthase [NAD(P)(+)]-like n=1 Tax=Aricia agestis TaxID=91739 RepID=UPI001C202E3B|nr:tRNA-dihydrouridine(47) synthase [NAD(P)(+)]-like [Aricia agestis]
MSTMAGVCKIKEEFVVQRPLLNKTPTNEVNGSEEAKRKLNGDNNEPEAKKPKHEEHSGNKKNKKRGQNKARPKTFRDNKESKPCPSIVNIAVKDQKTCEYTNCKYIHDPLEYLKSKQKDLGEQCHIYNLRGFCARGIACRYGSTHISAEGFNLIDEEKYKMWHEDTKNTIQSTLQNKLQKRNYDFTLAEKLVKSLFKKDNKNNKNQTNIKGDEEVTTENIGAASDEDLIKLLPREKKTIDWRDKLYLSPLTTVGNLPFRRICKQFGADVTCGEMALCEAMLKGAKQEWALVKRHESEDLFGAQICGNNAYMISKVAQLLQENTELDFIDLNLGCPIDLIYKKGGGSGMMHRLAALETSVRSASSLLSIPFTAKIRTGIYQDKKIAHNIAPKLAKWGASLITLHGRSKEARYTKMADWEYIEQCAQAAAPCPVFGNGDILSYEDYIQRRQLAPTVQGVMIGRGALVKPWVFTEIKEERLWDISSNERFDIIKKFCNYGLEHWGSDTQGVENTRRFLLEWLSFLYRYVPVGLLERPPQKINERPPTYFGRNDLETLMASGNCEDWIKISEMILGPVPDGFLFLPKHKANSYQ